MIMRSKLRKAAAFTLAGVLVVSLAACASGGNELSAELSGKIRDSVRLDVDGRNTVQTGQVVSIVLDEKQSIPYRWKPSVSDESKVKLIYDKGRTTSGNGMPGGDEGQHTFYFETMEPGECTIQMRLEYLGGGEHGKHGQSYSYTVTIEPPAEHR